MEAFQTPWKLASFGELEAIKTDIENGNDKYDESDERGFTPLCWAARNGHMDVMMHLIGLGNNKEKGSFGGIRPLHHACNKNNEKIIRALIQAKVEINAQDENGDTALHYASARGVLNVVVALIEAGASVKIANAQAVTAVHKAALFGQVAVVKRLVESGADINAKDSSGDTALHFAARCGFLPVVKSLVESGANSAAKNGGGQTPKDVALSAAVVQAMEADQ